MNGESLSQRSQRANANSARPGDKSRAADELDTLRRAHRQKLITAFQRLRRSRESSFQFIVCEARPYCGLMVADRITAGHRRELTRLTGGSQRFLRLGTCQRDDRRIAFFVDQLVPGLMQKLRDAIRHFTGQNFLITVGISNGLRTSSQNGRATTNEAPGITRRP